MRIACLNTTANPRHAPAGIMLDVARAAASRGDAVLVMYGRGSHTPEGGIEFRKIASATSTLLHAAASRVLDRQGFGSRRSAERVLDELKIFRPDVVHLHTLHGHYMHLPALLDGLGRMAVPVVITLHDMWLLTGRCCFPPDVCGRWKEGCHDCPDRTLYPPTLLSLGRTSHRLKTDLINSLPEVVLAAPSRWMAERARESMLHLCPVKVIYNAPSLPVLPRTVPDDGIFRVLALANRWEPRKHPELVAALIPLLRPDERITVIGDCPVPAHPQVSALPLISDPARLAATYASHSLLLNSSTSESFGMTVAEALAASLPVLVPPGGALAEQVGPDDGLVAPLSSPQQIRAAIDAVRSRTLPFHPEPIATTRRMTDGYLSLFDDLTRAQ